MEAHGGFRSVGEEPKAEAVSMEESRTSVDRLRGLLDTYLSHSSRKAGLLRKLQQSLPLDEISRERIAKLDSATKKLRSSYNARVGLEKGLESRLKELSSREKDLAAKRKKVLRDIESLEGARHRLAEATDNMYSTTFNRLNIAQQNLTYRRWELAQGVVHIFSLSSFEALKTPPTSPMRDASSKQRSSNSYDFAQGRQRNISICGLEVDSSVIKKNKDTLLDQDVENNAEKLATALGYVAHILQLLSAYFDIPLRYPVKPVNSRSYICDVVPVKQQNNPKGKQPSPGVVQPETMKFPLYIDHLGVERERTRFAYAVFLLNKDIEQILNAHGLDAYGVAPHFTLSNLHKFLSYSN